MPIYLEPVDVSSALENGLMPGNGFLLRIPVFIIEGSPIIQIIIFNIVFDFLDTLSAHDLYSIQESPIFFII